MHRLWLIFAQTATVCLAVLFVVSTLRPDLLPGAAPRSQVVTVREPAPGSPAPTPAAGAASYSEAVSRAVPSVVNIATTQEVKAARHPFANDPLFRRFFGSETEQEVQRSPSLGSGVIVSAEGYILTNNHVVASADDIVVSLADGRRVGAKIVGRDPETDLAVIKTDVTGLPAITLGQPDRVKVGDVVLAIGNPFGFGQTVTFGIVSALGRSQLGISTFENFIQTDAAINPGNSGGALIDVNGHLVGLNTAIFSGAKGGNLGIGFAIPVSLARQVMEGIIANGSVTRGWIGVEAHDLTRELAESFQVNTTRGALIAGVLRNGPADAAGVRTGDILVAVEGKPVVDSSSMLNLVAALAPGHKATLTVVRNRTELRYSVVVGRRPTPARE